MGEVDFCLNIFHSIDNAANSEPLSADIKEKTCSYPGALDFVLSNIFIGKSMIFAPSNRVQCSCTAFAADHLIVEHVDCFAWPNFPSGNQFF